MQTFPPKYRCGPAGGWKNEGVGETEDLALKSRQHDGIPFKSLIYSILKIHKIFDSHFSDVNT